MEASASGSEDSDCDDCDDSGSCSSEAEEEAKGEEAKSQKQESANKESESEKKDVSGGGGGGGASKLKKSAPPVQGGGGAKAKITLEGWKPDTPYLRAISAAPSNADKAYAIYLKQRSNGSNANLPAFYMDCSTHFFDTARPLAETDPASSAQWTAYGARILSNMLEIRLEDERLVRIVANRLWIEGRLDAALSLLLKVQRLRGEEPQSHREVGMVQSDLGNYQEAWDNLWHVIETDWPVRFQHIEDEIMWELQRTLVKAKKSGVKLDTNKCPKSMFEEFLAKPSPMDVRLNIAFDADDVCIDLHIDQPDGSTCYYGKHTTAIGGWSSPDYSGCTAYSTSMLREYTLKLGMPGQYKLRGNYYSKNRSDCLGASTIWFSIWTNYLSEGEKCDKVVIRLENSSTTGSSASMRNIGSMQFESNPSYKVWESEWIAPRKAYQEEQRKWKKDWEVFNTEKARIDALWAKYEKEKAKIDAANDALIKKYRS
eukprot:TRINITY_DN2630_c0_g2_i1.p1 TRINITY_DN2630_c0_g2~~TRINITY_DN2630_c0_g2_i1.p1  ORF type:complete len:485 (+),score=102.29 TRINITY_DN2630_c0_g2_i1:342-1796(+)